MRKPIILKMEPYLGDVSTHEIEKLEVNDYTEQTMRIIPKHPDWIPLVIYLADDDECEFFKNIPARGI